MVTPIEVVAFKCRKMFRMWNGWNCALFTGQKKTKFRLLLKLSLLRRSRPKSVRASLQHFVSHYSKFHPNRFIFGGVIAERAKAVLWAHRADPLFARSKAFGIIINRCTIKMTSW